MAAVYIHDSMIATEQHNPRPLSHTRNLSTVSSTTLHPSTSDHSQPTEPLLHQPITESSSTTFHDIPERPPVIPDRSLSGPAWERSIVLDGEPVSQREKKGLWELAVRRRLKRLRILKGAFECFIGAWTIYNTVMYFLAFTVYNSSEGQVISLALGISTGVSFALLACAAVLSFCRSHLLAHHFPIWILDRLRTVIRYLLSLLILGSSAVNLAMVNAIRRSSDVQLRLSGRCHFDIDSIWSVSDNPCDGASPAWGVWLTVAIVRLVMTITVLALYHLVSNAYERIRRPHARRRHSRRRRRQSHQRAESYDTSLGPAVTHARSFIPQAPRDVHRQDSETTLASSKFSGSVSHHQPRLGRSRSAGFSEEDHESNSLDPYPRPQVVPMPMDSSASLPAQIDEPDREMTGFVDRFRTLITQITRETQDAVEFAQSDTTSGRTIESPGPIDGGNEGDDEDEGDDEEGLYYRRPNLPPVLGYDELGRPYPPDEPVPILNHYITRMPTIDSVGSREMGSSVYSSERSHVRAGSSGYNSSRPPTRNTLLSWNTEFSGSQPPSRANSLSARVEMMLATSEVGELIVMNPSSGRSSAGTSGSSAGGVGGETPPSGEIVPSSTAASRSTYYTATLGSMTSGNSVPDGSSTPPPPMPQLSNTNQLSITRSRSPQDDIPLPSHNS
ncbi:hypothetical protein BDQ17DRAFT_1427609 [Cyathus striatus]|nr:hypothetical protein BDQ17DRAFT_1427609 [Cyathus striatus]